MKIGGKSFRTIWTAPEGRAAEIIDQTRLPFSVEIVRLESHEDAAVAIETMQVRGAPCIGATAAYGMFLGLAENASDEGLARTSARLARTRPTAVNLTWAINEITAAVSHLPPRERAGAARSRAEGICDEDVEVSKGIGRSGLQLIEQLAAKKTGPVNILTHCNAGWLATVDWGTATAPIYMAHNKGLNVHVWVDETRPRNQGASLTAFELGAHGVPHTVIVDNAGGHLMQKGMIDMCIVGTDRTARNGDVANKIGTYLKALAAHDNGVPFYVALPHTTIDWSIADGVRDIPIEERHADEVTRMTGRTADGAIETVEIVAEGSKAANYAFDVTPARLVSGLITERGVCRASESGLLGLYPERG
ncbi:MAG: S-methyl-5-thioribose-1-phosphate isomerase [Parvularculaceae bacterium]|nr:S-methyl-5-thioribose-1-phosphate isomerase [Parvularculaceae bacterium]